jgi:hypothetical protein
MESDRQKDRHAGDEQDNGIVTSWNLTMLPVPFYKNLFPASS